MELTWRSLFATHRQITIYNHRETDRQIWSLTTIDRTTFDELEYQHCPLIVISAVIDHISSKWRSAIPRRI